MADRRSEYVVSDLRGEFTHLTELLESYGGAQDFTGAHRHEGSDDRGHTFSTRRRTRQSGEDGGNVSRLR